MVKINLFDVIELKKAIKDQFSIDLHFHDSCAGQYFELEETNDMVIEFLNTYFNTKNIGVLFNDKKNSFTLVDIKRC